MVRIVSTLIKVTQAKVTLRVIFPEVITEEEDVNKITLKGIISDRPVNCAVSLGTQLRLVIFRFEEDFNNPHAVSGGNNTQNGNVVGSSAAYIATRFE